MEPSPSLIPPRAYRQSHSDGVLSARMRSCIDAILSADDETLLRLLSCPWPEGVSPTPHDRLILTPLQVLLCATSDVSDVDLYHWLTVFDRLERTLKRVDPNDMTPRDTKLIKAVLDFLFHLLSSGRNKACCYSIEVSEIRIFEWNRFDSNYF